MLALLIALADTDSKAAHLSLAAPRKAAWLIVHSESHFATDVVFTY